MRDLIAMAIAPEHLLDRAVDVAVDELDDLLDVNEPAVAERLRAALAAEVARQRP